MSQVQNQMLQEVEALLETEGYGFSKHVKLWKNHPTHHQVGYTLNITRRWDILRFLGEVRPVRLLPKLQLERFGQIRAMPARLVSKIFLGPCEVVALETSTKTLVVEGYASHNSACRYQIVGKLPFPSTQSKIIQARAATDPDYIPYLMTQALQQMVGRGVRSETDWCETLICDDHYSWVRKKYASHFKDWFTEAVRWSDLLPKPMEF